MFSALISNISWILSQRKDIVIVHRNGKITPVTDSSLTKPILGLFQRFMNDPQGMAINFGFETGQCSYCGRDLTDPISLKFGYGRICAEDLGLTYGFTPSPVFPGMRILFSLMFRCVVKVTLYLPELLFHDRSIRVTAIPFL